MSTKVALGWGVQSAANQVPFPGGASHVWKMDETSGTRFDSIGSSHLIESGGSVDYVAGVNGNAARFTGGSDRLETTISVVPAEFTISVWTRGTALDHQVMGPLGGPFTIYTLGSVGRIQLLIFDQVTFDSTGYSFEASASMLGWILIVARINNATCTGSLRFYGAPSGNGVNYSLAGSWVNPHTTLDLWPSGSEGSGGDNDEMVMWPRMLTDSECDRLQTNFWGTP
jgi:hypothetical protein